MSQVLTLVDQVLEGNLVSSILLLVNAEPTTPLWTHQFLWRLHHLLDGLVVDHSSNSNAKHMLNCPTIRTGLLVEDQVICRTQLTSCLVLEDPVPSKVVLDNAIEATLVDNRPPMT